MDLRAALYQDDGATLDDLREAVTTLEDTERIARRVRVRTRRRARGTSDHNAEIRRQRSLRDRREARLRAECEGDQQRRPARGRGGIAVAERAPGYDEPG